MTVPASHYYVEYKEIEKSSIEKTRLCKENIDNLFQMSQWNMKDLIPSPMIVQFWSMGLNPVQLTRRSLLLVMVFQPKLKVILKWWQHLARVCFRCRSIFSRFSNTHTLSLYRFFIY